MGIQNNDLLRFNAVMLLNKREVIESFEDFIEHHRMGNNEESYSESKRKVILSMCEEFYQKLCNCNIPSLNKPWYCYEYSLTNDTIKLELIKCEAVTFDEDGEIASMTSVPEYTLAEVTCEYLSVEQYATLYNVTVTTVRQWIRRGKLRTAKKSGREWRIPALADSPKRGFESVSYYWTTLPQEIAEAFPFLAKTNYLHLYQDEIDKKVFYAITGLPGSEQRDKISLTGQRREQLELMLVAADHVEIEDFSTGVQFTPGKRSVSLPLLKNEPDTDSVFESIIVSSSPSETAWFFPDDEPGASLNGEPEEYILPILWSFQGTFKDESSMPLGTINGYLVLNEEILSDGYDPTLICDDLSADLGYIMQKLTDEGGPLNDETGNPYETVLYIEEMLIDHPFQKQKIADRILRELPWLCKRLLHKKPDLLTYYVSDVTPPKTKKFYQRNGFKFLNNSSLLYAYTEA